MKIKCLISLLFIFISLKGASQQYLRDINYRDKINTDSIESNSKFDTLYSTDYVKRNGWPCPLDTISKDVANHRYRFFRFTMRNNAKKWTKMETIDSYGNYSKGVLSPYLFNIGMKDIDESVASGWSDILQTACMVYTYSDESGQQVIQQYVCDENSNPIFCFTRLPINNNCYMGFYRDGKGFPAEMRHYNSGSFGTLVKVMENNNGYDSIVQYTDSKGFIRMNADGVYATSKVYDDTGHLLKVRSCNESGNFVADKLGNCGYEYVWNENHTLRQATCMDEHWNPMRMPLSTFQNEKNIIRTHYIYDEYKRRIQEYYTDGDNIPDTNAYGTHKIVYKYDAKGNIVEIRCFDIKGNPSIMDESGVSIVHLIHDSSGNLLTSEYLDRFQRPIETEGYFSKTISEFDENGNEISKAVYDSKNSIESLDSYTERCDDHTLNYYRGCGIVMDSLDRFGRRTLLACYDSDREPTMLGEFSKKRIKYTEIYRGLEIEEQTYDHMNEPIEVDGVQKSVTYIDSLAKVKTIFKYSAEGVIVSAYSCKLDHEFRNTSTTFNVNCYGVPCRSGSESSLEYYQVVSDYSADENTIYSCARDEIGEADYMNDHCSVYSYEKKFSDGDSQYLDENNNEVHDFKALMDSLPKTMSIEIIDSIGYELGLKDNDLILKFGTYFADLSENSSLLDFKSRWAEALIENSGKSSDIILFRIDDADKKRCDLVKIENLKGSPSDLGFIPHLKFLTRKQKQRILNTYKDNYDCDYALSTCSQMNENSDAKKCEVIFAYPATAMVERNSTYSGTIKEPYIILGVSIPEMNLSWRLSDPDYSSFSEMLDSRSQDNYMLPSMSYYLTNDSDTIVRINTTSESLGCEHFIGYISENTLDCIKPLKEKVARILESVPDKPISFDTQNLIGHWKSIDDDFPYGSSVDLFFNGSGKVSSIFKNNLILTLDNMPNYPIYEYIQYSTCDWSLHDKCITLKDSRNEGIELQCVDFVDRYYNEINDEDVEFDDYHYCTRLIENAEILDSLYFYNRTYTESSFKPTIYIKSFNLSDTLTIIGSTGEEVSLVKTDNDKILSQEDSMQKKLQGQWTAHQELDIDDGKLYVSFNIALNHRRKCIVEYHAEYFRNGLLISSFKADRIGKYKISDKQLAIAVKEKPADFKVYREDFFNDIDGKRVFENQKKMNSALFSQSLHLEIQFISSNIFQTDLYTFRKNN